MNTGIFAMPADQYHADPCQKPSLSSSIIKALLNQSPMHAWSLHPRLNVEAAKEESSKFDFGTAGHSLVLEGIDKCIVIDAEDWRTKAAKEQRDVARQDGYIPVLVRQYADLEKLVGVAKLAILNCPDLSGFTFDQGKPEQTLIWQESNGVWCKARPDMLANDHSLILDYKTTSGSAEPGAALRQIMEQMDGDIQAAHYLRGLEAITGKKAKFIFMIQEIEAPYAVSFIGVSPTYHALGEDKVERAVSLFGECLERNEWPGYERRICWAEPKNWTLEKWYQKQNEYSNDQTATQET